MMAEQESAVIGAQHAPPDGPPSAPEAGEPEATGQLPIRRCLASGERLPQDCLLRFVVGPDGTLVPDLAGRLPGRGLWIRPDKGLLERAVARKLFARSARMPVIVPEDLIDRLGGALRRRCRDSLGLARRAGLVAAGHDKARGPLERGQAALLLQASDGSLPQRAKLANLGRGRCPGLEVIEILTAEELGDALGRGPTVHVALLPGGLAERVRLDCARLATYDAVRHDAGSPATGHRPGKSRDAND